MGNYQSTAEIKESPELKKYCYDAVDALIKMDKLYKEEVESVERVVPKGQNVNAGSNTMKTFNITGASSKVSLSQSTVLETTVKTAIYISAFTTMKLDPHVKVIICDLVGMTKEDSNEKDMPSYSDPKYLLRILGIKDVTEASIVGDEIVYKNASGINTKQPIQGIRDYVHKYYQATLDDKMAEAKNAIKTVTNNITVSTRNTASNNLNIKFRKMTDSTVKVNQVNESKQSVELEFSELADKLDKIANAPKKAPASSSVASAPPSSSTTSREQTSTGESASTATGGSTTTSVANTSTAPIAQQSAVTQNVQQQTPVATDTNNSFIIAVVIVVVIIVLGIIGVAVAVSLSKPSGPVMMPAYPPVYGGYYRIPAYYQRSIRH